MQVEAYCKFCKKKFLKAKNRSVKSWSIAKLRYELSNGRVLCIDCHRQTDTYGGKIFNYEIA